MSIFVYILGVYVALVFAWVLYLATMNLLRVRHDLHPVAKFNAYGIILPVGLTVDFILNIGFCALVFHRIPRDWLLTGTLKRTINTDDGWRSKAAAWICTHLLNQFDPKGKHC